MKRICIDTEHSTELEGHVFECFIKRDKHVFVELISPIGGDDIMFQPSDDLDGEYEVRWVRTTANAEELLEQIENALTDEYHEQTDYDEKELRGKLLHAIQRFRDLHY